MCDLLWLVSYTCYNVFKVYYDVSCTIKANILWLIFHCMDIVQLNYLFLSWRAFPLYLLFGHYEFYSYEHSCTNFVWAHAFSYLRRRPTSMLWSLCRTRMYPHPKFGLHIKSDDATYISIQYEKLHYNEAFWEEQEHLPSWSKNCLGKKRNGDWFGVFIVIRG